MAIAGMGRRRRLSCDGRRRLDSCLSDEHCSSFPPAPPSRLDPPKDPTWLAQLTPAVVKTLLPGGGRCPPRDANTSNDTTAHAVVRKPCCRTEQPLSCPAPPPPSRHRPLSYIPGRPDRAVRIHSFKPPAVSRATPGLDASGPPRQRESARVPSAKPGRAAPNFRSMAARVTPPRLSEGGGALYGGTCMDTT